MIMYPEKFLWQNLLSFWEGKIEEMITSSAVILAKMDVVADPGVHMSGLLNVLA